VASVRRTSAPPAGYYTRDHDEINLAPYVRRLYAGRYVIVGCAVVAVIAVVLGLTLLPPQYESSATLVVAQAKIDIDTVAPSTAEAPFRVIFQNYGLVSSVTKEFELDKPPFNLTPHEFLRSNLRVDEIRGLSVLKVSVVLRDDAERTAAVTNALARGAVKIAQRISEEEALLVTQQLRTPLEDARTRLNAAEQALIARREQIQIEVRKTDATTALTQRGDLQKLLSEIVGEHARLTQAEQDLAKQSRIVEVPRMPGTASALLDLAKEDAKDRDDKRSLSGLNLESSAINPVYEALQYQVALSRSRLAGLESERRALEAKGLGGDALAQFKGVYSQELELGELESSHKLLTKIYEDIALRYEQARSRVTSKSAQLQVIDDAVPADRPLSRGRTRWGAVALLLGGAFGSLVVLVRRRYSAERRDG